MKFQIYFLMFDKINEELFLTDKNYVKIRYIVVVNIVKKVNAFFLFAYVYLRNYKFWLIFI